MKTNFLVIFLISILGACTPITAIAPTSTIPLFTPTLPHSAELTTDTVTPTPVSTVTSTAARIPQITTATDEPLKPSAIPKLPDHLWADGIQVKYVNVRLFAGAWSPVSDEMVIHQFEYGSSDPSKLVRLSAPDFTPQVLSNAVDNYLYSPDGQTIYFYGLPHDSSHTYSADCTGAWSMDHEGKQPAKQFGDLDCVRMPSWVGWMDPNTIVTTDYAGGGHEVVYFLNKNTGKSILRVPVFGVTSSIGKDYLAVEGQGTLIINAAVGRNLPLAPNILWDDALEKIRFIPIAKEFYPTAETCFMGWLPGTNLMLAHVNTWKDNYGTSNKALVWWDVDQNLIIRSIDDARGGMISPDGRYLAYVTINSDVSTLHIEDLASQKNLISLPVKSFKRSSEFCSLNSEMPDAAFSKDGRYLAIHSLSQMITDSNGVLKDQQNEHPGENLAILDIKKNKILFARDGASQPSWSPSGDSLVFMDANHQWVFLNIDSGKETMLTHVQDIADNPQWSFDGEYIMFSLGYNNLQAGIAFVKVPPFQK